MAERAHFAWEVTPDKVNEVVQRLVEAGAPNRIILFGSYVTGETDCDSDLDVLVVVENSLPNTHEESARLRRAVRGIPICLDIVVVRQGDFDRLKDARGFIYREAERHGKTVYQKDAAEWISKVPANGRSSPRPIMFWPR